MPFQTDLTVTPWNDTVPATSDYQRLLFQPGVSLQSRELIEMQSMFGRQIERMGDNVFKPGTIVSGCNFLFYDPYPYVKLTDQDASGNPVTVAAYANLSVINATTGLRAHVVNTLDGFVSADPNLKTLYLNYLNTGYNSNTATFAAGDTLTVYDATRNGIEAVTVENGGSGFSNTNTLFAVSALAVQVQSGSITNGQYIVNGQGANVQVVGIDSVTLANSGQVILSVAPRAVDLANASVNATAWTVSNGQSFTNSGNTASGVVTGVIGYGYQGLVVTNSLGSITQVLTLNKGFGYTSLPYVTLQSANNSGGFGSLSLEPQNYVAQVIVASTANSVGNGYAFAVNQGVCYLEGALLAVPSQSIIVSPYNTDPDGVSVVFQAVESIVNADIDPTLNDPAAGPNNGAPGADRLKVTVQLAVVNTAYADANTNLTPLVEWNEGNPYIQNQPTQFAVVGDAIATAAFDLGGNFYIDPFQVTTSSSLANDNPFTAVWNFDLVVDPGTVYIDGYKVQTTANYIQQMPFAFGSVVSPFQQALNYGNYLTLTNLGGTFQYNTGDVVQLYSLAKGFTSNSVLVRTGNTNPVGAQMGTARIRSLVPVSGTPGTNTATYQLYIFDVQMNAGYNFGDVESVYYNGTNKGIADVVLGVSSTGNTVAQATASQASFLTWQTGYPSVKNVNAASYQFSGLDQTQVMANTGVLTWSLATAGQSFAWPGSVLSASQAEQVIVVPTAIDLVSNTAASGTWLANNASNVVIANTGSGALSYLASGDWVTLVGNTTQSELHQVTQVINNIAFAIDSDPSFSNTSCSVYRTFPHNLPIPLNRAGVTANVSSNGTVMTVNLGFGVNTAVSQALTVGAPIAVANVSPTPKVVNRQAFIAIDTANNAAGTTGPWCIGVPDVFRLRGVYIGSNSTNANTSGTNWFSSFAIDSGQNSDWLDLAWLYLDTNAVSPVTSGSWILVEFDYYTSSTGLGYYATPSYTQSTNALAVMLTDYQPLSNLTSSASTWEIPEYFTPAGIEVDLMGCIDFRPYASNTCAPSANQSTAPVNPSNVTTFSTVEKRFPYPGSVFAANCEYYVPRMDTTYVTANGQIITIRGQDLVNSGQSPQIPPGTMKIADVGIPAYPDLPASRSASLLQVINTGVVNQKFTATRTTKQSIALLSTYDQNSSKVYTNQDIADLDNRIKNLEYYVNLNQLETATQTMVIPSSLDPTVNRYQYGFFADDFSTGTLSDVSYPTYAAQMENGDVVPSKLTWEVFLGVDSTGALPYITQNLIGQLNATIGTTSDPTAQPRCAVALANTVAYQLVYRQASDQSGLFAPSNGAVDVVTVTMADAAHMSGAQSVGTNLGIDSASANNLGSAAVTLWFYAFDNPVEFQVVQGNTVVADSSTATALSANDVLNLTTGTIMNQWFNDQTSLYLKNPVVVSGAFVEYAGKVTFNYSGSGSQQLSIRTTNGNGVHDWRWVLSYPINGDSAGCNPPPPVISCPSGYTYDPTSGGCVMQVVSEIIQDFGPPPPTIFSGVFTPSYPECGNEYQEVLPGWLTYQIMNDGLTTGMLTVTLEYPGVPTTLTLTGTLQDFLQPNSPQTLATIKWDATVLQEAAASGNGQLYNYINWMGPNWSIASEAVGIGGADPFWNTSYSPTQDQFGTQISYQTTTKTVAAQYNYYGLTQAQINSLF